MNLSEARNILGLGPEEDPRPHVDGFADARHSIASLVESAPNEAIAARYREGLTEFDQALALIKAELTPERENPAASEFGQAPTPHPASAEEPPKERHFIKEPPKHSTATPEKAGRMPDSPRQTPPRPVKAPTPVRNLLPENDPIDLPSPVIPQPPRRKSRASLTVWVFLLLIGATCGGIYYVRSLQEDRVRRHESILQLQRDGADHIENRRWEDATLVFAEIEKLSPNSPVPAMSRKQIQQGMAEEQRQFIGYWSGQTIAELEAGRLDEAMVALERLKTRFPDETQIPILEKSLERAHSEQARAVAVAAARSLLEDEQWQKALDACDELLSKYPDDNDALTIAAAAQEGRKILAARHKRALDLLEFATTRDTGAYDQKALDALREAAALFPGNPDIAKRLEKMSTYSRTLRVPEDHPTPAEAIAAARPRDRIILGENVWKGPYTINKPVTLQGAGSGKTIIECPPTQACTLTIGPEADGTRISGITFRHSSFHAEGADRFSAVLVRGGGVTFTGCHFTGASGHGLAVIEKGEVIATRCRFATNGWNGAAAIGHKTYLEIRDSEALANFEHGIESWNGAAVILANNLCSGNIRNGIHADNRNAEASIENNQLLENREFGLVLDSAGSGRVNGNTASGNLLGGLVIKAASAPVAVRRNTASRNNGPGIVLEKGLQPEAYADNNATDNKPQQVVTNALLSPSNKLTGQ